MASFRWKKSAEVLEKEIEQDKKLIDAVNEGDTETVEALLKEGVSPDATEYNRTLFYASRNYLTPIQLGVKHGFTDIVRLLIEYEGDVNAKDRFDVTAVHMASEKGNLKILQLLLEGGADCNVATKYSKYGSYTATPHPGGTIPLHLASSQNHIQCAVELIWYGADYNAVDEFGRTSMYIAAQNAFADCVLVHLNNAIRMDILSLPAKDTNETPLHECVRHGLTSCVKALLKHGSDVNHRNSAGLSPLHLAVLSGEKFSMDILKALVTIGYNTDVNLKDKHGNTPLHYVSFTDHTYQERRPHAASFLVAYGADHNIKNKTGDSLLQQEIRNNKSERIIIEAIINSTLKLPNLDVLCPSLSVSGSRLLQEIVNTSQKSVTSETCNDKFKWYNMYTKGPRSLQHNCRCCIRDYLGCLRLRNVQLLPLPTTLKDYLLLDVETFG